MLEDIELIENLEKTKATALDIEEKAAEAIKTQVGGVCGWVFYTVIGIYTVIGSGGVWVGGCFFFVHCCMGSCMGWCMRVCGCWCFVIV